MTADHRTQIGKEEDSRAEKARVIYIFDIDYEKRNIIYKKRGR